jgi:MFS family permease
MNIVYSLSAYPLGALSDKVDRRWLFGIGFAILIASDIVLAVAPNLPAVFAGVALWGLHMGMTQGLLAALIADEAPAQLRATSFGVFNFVSGIALLLASLTAGVLWDMIGPYATFMAGAAFSLIGLLGTAAVLRKPG